MPGPQRTIAKRIRYAWLAVAIALVTAASALGYFAHEFQKDRNTRRLLQDAQIAHQKGDFLAAIDSYGIYLDRNSSDVVVLRQYTDLLSEQLPAYPKLIRPTLRALRQLNRAEPEDDSTTHRLIQIYMDIREFGLARDLARSWLGRDPENGDAILALARALHGNNENEAALDVLTRAAQAHPHEARLYPPLIELLDSILLRSTQVEEWLQQGLRSAPDAYETHMAAFLYFENHDQFDAAKIHLNRALELAPRRTDVLVPAIRFFMAQGELENAAAILSRAVEIDPESPDVLAARHAFAVQSHDSAALISVADDLRRLGEKGDRTLLVQAAELYLRAGAEKPADECIAALRSTTTQSVAPSLMETLLGAQAFSSNRMYSAIAHLESALKDQPDDPWTLEMLARAFLRIAAFENAEEMYQRMALLNPSGSTPRIALARLALQTGRRDRATEHLAAIKWATPTEKVLIELLGIRANLINPPTGNPDELLARLESATPSLMNDPAALEILVHAFVDAGKADRAVDIWRSWSGDLAARRRIGLDLGRRLVSNGDIARATTCINAMEIADSNGPETVILRCEIQIARGEVNAVRQIADSPGLPDPQRGAILELLADHATNQESRTALLADAAALRPDDIAVRQELAQSMSDANKAMQIVDQIRGIEGERGVLWKLEKASVLLRNGNEPQNVQSAVNLLRDCLEARPGWSAARGLMGYAQELQGQLTDAVEYYRSALALSSELDAPAITLRLVGVLKKLGRFTEADSALAPLARAMPESVEVKKLVAEQHIRHRNWTSAAVVAELVLDADPKDAFWVAVTADLHLYSGNPAKSEEVARIGLAATPDSFPVVASLARSLLAQKKNEEALSLARQYSDRKLSGVFDVLLARVLVECDRPEEAAAVLDAALAREPLNTELHMHAAEFWGSLEQQNRQLDLARKALQLRGDDPAESLVLASLLLEAPDESLREEAGAIIRRRLDNQPRDVEALVLNARLALLQTPPDDSRAQTSLRAALKINPRLPAAHKILSAIHLQRGEISNAEESIAAGLIGAPDDPELLELSAEVREHRGDHLLALIPLRKLMELGNPSPRAIELFALAAAEANQMDEAILVLGRLKLDFVVPYQAIALAGLYERKGELDRAEQLLRDAFAQAPQTALPALLLFQGRRGAYEVVKQIGREQATGRPDDVVSQLTAAEILAAQTQNGALRRTGFEWLEQLAISYPTFAADARYRAGLAHLQGGDLLNAEMMLRLATNNAPLNPKPVNALAWLYGTELGDPQRGLNELNKFETAGGIASVEILDTYGALLLRLRRFEESALKLGACLRLSGQSPTRCSALFHLSLVQFETGATQDALINLKSAMQLNERVGGLNPRQIEEARRRLSASVSTRS